MLLNKETKSKFRSNTLNKFSQKNISLRQVNELAKDCIKRQIIIIIIIITEKIKLLGK